MPPCQIQTQLPLDPLPAAFPFPVPSCQLTCADCIWCDPVLKICWRDADQLEAIISPDICEWFSEVDPEYGDLTARDHWCENTGFSWNISRHMLRDFLKQSDHPHHQLLYQHIKAHVPFQHI